MTAASSCNSTLLNLLATLLAPLFLDAADQDYALARAAALDTIADYGAGSSADLLLIAQTIAFSLVSMSTLMQSLADDLDPETALRMQTTANALGTRADRARAVLGRARPPASQAVAQSAPREPAPNTQREPAATTPRESAPNVPRESASNTQREPVDPAITPHHARQTQPAPAPRPVEAPSFQPQPSRPRRQSGHGGEAEPGVYPFADMASLLQAAMTARRSPSAQPVMRGAGHVGPDAASIALTTGGDA